MSARRLSLPAQQTFKHVCQNTQINGQNDEKPCRSCVRFGSLGLTRGCFLSLRSGLDHRGWRVTSGTKKRRGRDAGEQWKRNRTSQQALSLPSFPPLLVLLHLSVAATDQDGRSQRNSTHTPSSPSSLLASSLLCVFRAEKLGLRKRWFIKKLLITGVSVWTTFCVFGHLLTA